MNTIVSSAKKKMLSSSGSDDAHISGETLSLLEEQPVKASTHHQRGRGSKKTVAGFVVCALSLGSALALSSSTSASSNTNKNNNSKEDNNNVESLFARGSPMAQLGVQDQIEVMKSLIVDTCGKAALREYEASTSAIDEEEGKMGEREDGQEKGGKIFAKADAFLSKLDQQRRKTKNEEEEEDLEIDSSKNADKFLREFNDMEKTMKETKKFAKEASEEDDDDDDENKLSLEELKSSEGSRAVEEEEDARFEKKLSKSLLSEEEEEDEKPSSSSSSRSKAKAKKQQSMSSRKSPAEEEEEKEWRMERERRQDDSSKRVGGYGEQEKFRSDADDEQVLQEKEEEREDRRRSSSSSRDNNNQRERLYERRSSDRDDDKSNYASKGARRMLLADDAVEVAEEELKHTGLFALLQKMIGGEQSSQDPVKAGQAPQLGLPKLMKKGSTKGSSMKKKKEATVAGLGKSMGIHVDEEDDEEIESREEEEEEENEEQNEEEEEEEPKKQQDEETRTDKVLKLAQDGEKALEREAIEKVYKGDGSKSKKKSALELQRGETSSLMSETDEEALEIENNAADKYYDVTKVEHLAQETLKRNMASKGEASMGEQTINTKALEEAIGRAANQSPDVTRKELFSTLGRKSKAEFINAARLKKLVELKHIATTCKPTLTDGGKAMERAKEAAQQAAMKVKQAAARRAEAEANYEHSQEVAKIAAQKVDDITELAQKKIQEVQEVAKRKVQNAKDISRLAGRKVEDEFDMLGKTKEDFNLHVQHAMNSVEAAKAAASAALEETKKKSETAKQRAAALEVSLAKEYEEARTEREIEEKKLAKAEAQAEAAETEREQKVLEAHQRQMEIEKVAKERQYKLEEEQRQMEAAKRRSMAKSTQYRTSAEDALEKLSVIDFDNNKDSDDVARIGFGEDVAYPDETEMAMGAASDSADGFDPWTK
jgi:hypothetical protein